MKKMKYWNMLECVDRELVFFFFFFSTEYMNIRLFSNNLIRNYPYIIKKLFYKIIKKNAWIDEYKLQVRRIGFASLT